MCSKTSRSKINEYVLSGGKDSSNRPMWILEKCGFDGSTISRDGSRPSTSPNSESRSKNSPSPQPTSNIGFQPLCGALRSEMRIRWIDDFARWLETLNFAKFRKPIEKQSITAAYIQYWVPAAVRRIEIGNADSMDRRFREMARDPQLRQIPKADRKTVHHRSLHPILGSSRCAAHLGPISVESRTFA